MRHVVKPAGQLPKFPAGQPLRRLGWDQSISEAVKTGTASCLACLIQHPKPRIPEPHYSS